MTGQTDQLAYFHLLSSIKRFVLYLTCQRQNGYILCRNEYNSLQNVNGENIEGGGDHTVESYDRASCQNCVVDSTHIWEQVERY